MKYRKQMAVRIYMEKSIEKPRYSYFITLTYNEDNIPTIAGRPCFDKRHLQTFFDSLRHAVRNEGYTIRYFATCEYGEEGYRPHYHLLLLLYGRGRQFGRHQFLHEFIEPLWNRGFCYDGNVSLASIMYCTAYALKDDEALERDWSGFEAGRPFRLFSNRPGLGLTDNCVNWWTNYSFNDGDVRTGITIHLSKRSVSTGIPIGVKRKIKDTYSDVYEILKEGNETARQESLPELAKNHDKYGGIEYYHGARINHDFDTSPDEDIKVFRKALRELGKRQRNPLK